MQTFHSKQSLTAKEMNVFMTNMRREKLTEQLSFRVSGELYELIEEIARRERRKQNEVARALLERGVAAFQRDKQIFEPSIPVINAVTESTSDKRRKRA